MSWYTSVKFAQQIGRVSDKIEGLNYSAKSIENDQLHHESKHKKKVWAKNVVFSYIADFPSQGGDRRTFMGSKESQDLKVLNDENFHEIFSTRFLVFKHHQWSPKELRTQLFLLSCVRFIKYLYLQLNFLTQRYHTHV